MTTERRRFWVWAGAATLAGLLLRLWFIRHYENITGDGLVYGAIAKNWLQTGTYGFGHFVTASGEIKVRPTLIRLPGYPLFLAACFRVFAVEHYRAVLYVQALADLATCWLSAAVARRLFGGRAFLPVLWAAALCPFTANYVAAPLTETLVLLTIALAFYGFVRWRDVATPYNRWLWIVAAGLSYSILLRPDQGLLAAAILPAMLWRLLVRSGGRPASIRARATPVLVASLCVLLPLVPWTARNWRTFHVFQPLAPRSADDPGEQPSYGFYRWYRTWAIDFASTDTVYWNYNSDRVLPERLPARAFALGCHARPGDAPLYERTAGLLHDYNVTTTDSPAFDARFQALAVERIRAAPLCYSIGLPVARVFNMLVRPRLEMLPLADEWWKARPAQRAFAYAYGGLNLVYLMAALAGMWVWYRRRPMAFGPVGWALAGCVALRLGLLLTLDNSETRYTLELFPVFYVWMGGLFAQREEAG